MEGDIEALQAAATQVTKAEFPEHGRRVCWESFCKVGSSVLACTLCPIPQYPIQSSVGHTMHCSSEHSQTTQHQGHRSLQPHLTPLRLHLQDHFTKLLAAKTQHSGTGNTSAKESKKKIRLDYHGQGLTSDEVAMMIEQKEKEKKSTKKSMSACVSHTHLASYV